MRFLGRKAELPNLLRDVGPAAAGGARRRRQGRQPGAPGARGGGRRARGPSSRRGELDARLAADVVDVTLPGSPVAPVGRLHLLTATRREIEDVFLGLGFRVVEGPEIDLVYYNFDALNHDAAAPGAAGVRHLLRRRRRRPAHAHLADAGARDGARSRRRCTSSSPAAPTGATTTRRTRRSSTRSRASRSTRTSRSADLKGTLLAFARAIFGDDRDVRLRPHFFPFTEPSVELDVSCFNCNGRASCATARAAPVQGRGLDRDPRRRRWSTRTSSATCASTATTPSASRASPSAWASSGSPSSSTASPTCGMFYENDLASWSSSDEAAPVLAARLRRPAARASRRSPTRLTMTGTKVERVHTPRRHRARALRRRHGARAPSSTRTPTGCRSATVDVGEGDAAQIVCGAPNVAAGQTVAVASPGAVMPDGTQLKTRQAARRQPSNGMILAEDEVAIGTDHDGIMVLDDDAARRARRWPTCCRSPPTCSSSRSRRTGRTAWRLRRRARGPRRHRRAAGAAAVARRSGHAPAPSPASTVEVEDPDLCPRFTARLFEDVTIGPSPAWLKARLMAAGQRPINNVVDITNYVMLLTGQPLHAFDSDLVAGGRLVVRRARDGETDDDARRRRAHAGRRDAASSTTPTARPRSPASWAASAPRSSDGTTRVLMEAANWDGPNIQRTSTRLGLRTEASGRFEKGLAPEQAMEGQAVATQLMLELTGARLVEGTIDVGGAGPGRRDDPAARRAGRAAARHARSRAASRPRILERARLRRRRGRRRPRRHRARLPPQRRHPRGRPRRGGRAHLGAREAARPRCPRAAAPAAASTPEQRLRRRAEDALVGAGLLRGRRLELQPPEPPRRLRLGTTRAPVALRNPMTEEQSVMRTTLLGSLLDAVRAQRARAATADVRLFEVGSVYFDRPHGARAARRAEARSTPLPDERTHLAALLTGRAAARRRGATATPPARGLLRRQGRAGDAAAARCACRCDGRAAARSRSCTRAARRACWSAARPPAGSASCTRASPRSGTSGGSPASSSTSASCSPPRRRRARSTEDLTSFPAIRQDLAFWFPGATARRPSSSRSCAAPAASCCADARGLRRLRARAAQTSLACGSSSAPPTAR